MGDTIRIATRAILARRTTGPHTIVRAMVLAIATAVLAAVPLTAQSPLGRAAELGIDAGAVFGLGSQSSIDINLPGSRFRMGFFTPGSRISIEPGVGLGYHKVEGVDGVFTYDLELGLLYHFTPLMVSTATSRGVTARVTSPYVRPFIGITGFSGGGSNGSGHEVSTGAGLGIKIPWRTDLAWRLEANLGYGFDHKAGRIGTLLGLSYFPR
ncbi:MAG TPA: hypothetical protein VGP25_11280 [Gemmatimonadaceae bacterium]|jgi:hypothetical protein|nr:hypothetical protein [Gemmatimonadaceae bacterium]